jgi:hypothetical protein
MKTQPLSIDPATLEDSRQAAENAGMSWSAYAARAIRKQVIRDNLRRAWDTRANRTPEQIAEDDTWAAMVSARLTADQ